MVQIEDRTHASHVNNRIGFLTVEEPGSSNSRKGCLRMGARPVLVSLGHNRAAPGGSEGSEVTTRSGCGSGNVLLLLLNRGDADGDRREQVPFLPPALRPPSGASCWRGPMGCQLAEQKCQQSSVPSITQTVKNTGREAEKSFIIGTAFPFSHTASVHTP